MEKDKLLTKKDLAKRWQISERTVDQYKNDGVIVPISGIPCVRFNLQYIEKIEGYIPEKTTIRERKLERELEDTKKERDYLKSLLTKILNESSKVINFEKEDKYERFANTQ
jgi:predicted site-specific integrase-resolvase